MRRLLATLPPLGLLIGTLLGPAPARSEELYSFVDADGVIHVTNVPEDRRYHRVRGSRPEPGDTVHRIVISGRARAAGRRVASARAGASPYDEHIRLAAEKYGLSPPLLKAVMAVESNFDPGAISVKGATGLMQLMPGTARDLSVDPSDPAQNIEGGARYLRQLHDRFGNDLEKVLAAYNAGPEAVRRSGGAIPNIPETQAYVRKVLSLYEAYLKGR